MELGFGLLRSQESFYYAYKSSCSISEYNVAECIYIDQEIDVRQFKAAAELSIKRIEILNCNIRKTQNGLFLAKIENSPPLDISDCSYMEDPRRFVEDDMASDFLVPIDVENGSIYRQKLYILSPEKYVWYFCTSHVVLDGLGVSQVLKRVSEQYRKGNVAVSYQKMPSLYDVIRAEKEYDSSEKKEIDAHYWNGRLKAEAKVPSFSRSNYAEGATCRYQAKLSRVSFLKEDWVEKLLLGVAVSLYARSGVTQVPLGFPVMCRTSHAACSVPVCRINVLPLVVSLDPSIKVKQHIDKIKGDIKSLIKHQEYRIEDIKRDLGLSRIEDIFRVIVNVLPFDNGVFLEESKKSRIVNLKAGAVRDISFNIRPNIPDGEIYLEVDFNDAMYNHFDVRDIVNEIKNFYETLSEENYSIGQILKRIPKSVINNNDKGCRNFDVLEKYSDISHTLADKVALCDDDNDEACFRHLTYSELYREVEEFSRFLVKAGVEEADCIIIDVPRSAHSIIIMLAAINLKIPFTAVNSKASSSVKEKIMGNHPGSIWISSGESGNDFPHWFEVKPVGLKGWGGFCSYAGMPPTSFKKNDRLAYVMYTSGTTSGSAKGVAVSRDAMNSFIYAAITRYGLDSHDIILNFSDHSYDSCIEEIFCSLCTGATLIIRPDHIINDFERFFSFCNKKSITVLDLPTSFWNQLARSRSLFNNSIESLRLVIVGGESINEKAIDDWQSSSFGNVQLMNSYGPTEATVVATVYDIPKNGPKTSIGTPIKGVGTAVVDEMLSPVMKGVVGELIIFGDTIADSYIKESDEGRFVSFDWNKKEHRAYRTGDLVYQSADNLLYFIGRIGHEVKVSGYRINLEELEASIQKECGVLEVCAAVRSDDPGRISLFFYGPDNTESDVNEILKKTQPRLGGLIRAWQIGHPLPKLKNGKIDRVSIKKFEVRKSNTDYNGSSESELSKAIVTLWNQYLGSAEKGRSFVQLGGESIAAIMMTNEINEMYAINMPIRIVLESQDCASLIESVYRELLGHCFDDSCIEARLEVLKLGTTKRKSVGPQIILCENSSFNLVGEVLKKYDCDSNFKVLVKDLDADSIFNKSSRIDYADLLVSVVPESSDKIKEWLSNWMKIVSFIGGENIGGIILIANLDGERWISKNILRNFMPSHLHIFDPVSSLRMKKQVVWFSKKLGCFPNIPEELEIESMESKIAEILGFNHKPFLFGDLYRATQSECPGIQRCDLAQWLEGITNLKSGTEVRI